MSGGETTTTTTTMHSAEGGGGGDAAMEDVVTTRGDGSAAAAAEYTFVVPFQDEDRFVDALRRGGGRPAPSAWRVAPPETLERIMRRGRMRDEGRAGAGLPPAPAPELERGGGVALMRVGLFARCQSAIAQHVRVVIDANLPSIDAVFREMLVARTARQLAQWAMYNIEPMDLREGYRDRVHAANARESPWTASRRERDARAFFDAAEGRLEGPLAASNQALRDWLASTGGVGGDDGRYTASKGPPNEFALRGIVTVLIRELMEAPRAPGGGLAGPPKPVARIMEHARHLSTQDGVPLVRGAAGEAPQVVLVRAAKVLKLLGVAPKGPGEGEGAGEGGHEAEEARRIVEEWRQARQAQRANPRELIAEPLDLPQAPRPAGASWGAIRDQLGGGGSEGGNAGSLPQAAGERGGERVRVGYEARDRLAYYRREALDPETGALPVRARLPLKEAHQIVFLKQQRTALDMATDWEMAPNLLVRTCPMINLLLEGASPDAMGSHAVLDQYVMLLWLAVDRTEVPCMRPAVPSLLDMLREKDDQHGNIDEYLAAGDRTNNAFASLRAGDETWAAVPDWCGRWFLPRACMPPALDERALATYYPQGTPQRDIIGVTWLRYAQRYRQEHPDAPYEEVRAHVERELTPSVLIDLFGSACANMEREAERDRAEARARAQAKDEAAGKAKGKERGGDGMEDEGEEEGGGVQGDDEWGGEGDPFGEYAREQMAAYTEPDRSRAGRAETLLVLNAIPAHYENVRQCLETHNRRIEELRVVHGDGVDCGNGYAHVRPAAYYEALWTACIEYTSAILTIHEMAILLAHSRWLDADKARARMLAPGTRALDLDAAAVAGAPEVAVRRVKERRERALRRRMLMDGRGAALMRGLARMVRRDGTLVEEGVVISEGGWWLMQPVPTRPYRGEAAGTVRPDAPTYMEMILFDTLIDYTPEEHEEHGVVGSGAGGGADGGEGGEDLTAEMNALADRAARMKLSMAREQEVNPDERLAEYDLPLRTTMEAEQEAYRAATRQGDERQTKRGAGVPFADYDVRESGAARPDRRRRRGLEEAMAGAANGGAAGDPLRVSTNAAGMQRVEWVRTDGTTEPLTASTTTESMALD